MSEDLYYIISTKQSACLNELFSTETFHHIRRNQPDSGPFLDAVLSSPRPVVNFVLFDRVDGSENSWKISHIYKLKSIQQDSNKDDAKEPHYELSLTPVNYAITCPIFWNVSRRDCDRGMMLLLRRILVH